MQMRECKLDLKGLREAAQRARVEIATWPKWKQDAVRVVSYAAASEESRKVLYGVVNDCN